MKITLNVICTLLVVTFLLTGCGLDISDDGTDTPIQTELEGIWTGSEMSDSYSEWTFVFSGNRFNATDASEEEWYSGTFSVNTSSTPKQINLVILDCTYCDSGSETCLGFMSSKTLNSLLLQMSPETPNGPHLLV